MQLPNGTRAFPGIYTVMHTGENMIMTASVMNTWNICYHDKQG